MAIFQPPSSMSASLDNPSAEAISTPVDIQPPAALQQPPEVPVSTPERVRPAVAAAQEPAIDTSTSDGIAIPEAAPEETEVNPFDAEGMSIAEVNPFDAEDMVAGPDKGNALIKAADDANAALKNAINPERKDEYGQPRADTLQEAVMKPLQALGAVFQELGIGYEAALTTAGMDDTLAKQLASFISGAAVGGPGSTSKPSPVPAGPKVAPTTVAEATERGITTQMEGMFNKPAKPLTPVQAAAESALGKTAVTPTIPSKNILPMTGGEASQSAALQRFEADVMAGTKGPKAEEAANLFTRQRNEAIEKSIQELGEAGPGGNPAEHVGALTSIIKNKAAESSKQVNEAYDLARTSAKDVDMIAEQAPFVYTKMSKQNMLFKPGDVQNKFVSALDDIRDTGPITPNATPAANDMYQQLTKLVSSQKADLINLEKWRTATTNLAFASTNKADRRALGKMIGAYDDYMDDVANRLMKQTGMTEQKASDILTRKLEAPEGLSITPETRLKSLEGFDMKGVKTEPTAIKTKGMPETRQTPAVETPSELDLAVARTITHMKEAVVARKEHGQRYSGNKIVEDMLSGESSIDDVAKKFVGTVGTGSKKEMLDNYNAVLRAAGDEAPVAQKAVQNAFTQRLYNNISDGKLPNSDLVRFSPKKLEKELTDMFVKQREFATALYGHDKVVQANRAIAELKQINAKQPSVGNVSGTAYTLQRLASGAGMLGHLKGMGAAVKLLQSLKNIGAEQTAATEAAQTFAGQVPKSFSKK